MRTQVSFPNDYKLDLCSVMAGWEPNAMPVASLTNSVLSNST